MKSIRQFKNKKITGFTLIELIVSIVILGIIAMMTSSFFKPAVDSYVSSRNRANLTEMADVALRNISREVQTAVPSSFRVNGSNSCIQFIPSKSGGAFVSTSPQSEDGKVVNNSFGTWDTNPNGNALDILALSPNKKENLTGFDGAIEPVEGDFIAIGALSEAEIYDDKSAISELKEFKTTSVTEPAIGRLVFDNKPPFSTSYDGNHFYVIDKNKKSIVYICNDDVSASADGKSGTGKLYKKVINEFKPKIDDNNSCDISGASVVIDNLSSCNFTYDSQLENASGVYLGYLNISLGLTQKGETINLNKGIHVDNLP